MPLRRRSRAIRIFIDSANLSDIQKYNEDDAISGFTTNATLVKKAGTWAADLVEAAHKDISVEYGTFLNGPSEHVRYKITDWAKAEGSPEYRWNLTAVCSPQQVPGRMFSGAIISVFAGRIMDTGRSPEQIIRLAQRTGAQVLWASSRCVYDIHLAEQMGCDIITVTPAIYEKYREWHGKPLELVAQETIAQFERDRA